MQAGGVVATRWESSERTRKFGREVGGIVLGVLIALGLGAIASEIGWRVEVRGAKSALEVELGELIGQADERLNVSPCIQRRLDQLAGIVDDAARLGRLPPLGAIANPPYRTWPRGIWSSTVSAETAAHFERDLLDNYSSFYEFVVQVDRATARELDVWMTLHALVGPGRVFSATDATAMRGAISEARFLDRFVGLNGVRMRQVADALELAYDPQTVSEYADRDVTGDMICKPIARDAPARYGQAPMTDAVQRALANPITRTDVGLGPTRSVAPDAARRSSN